MNFQDDVPLYIELGTSIEARWFRVAPQQISGNGHFRFEVYGLPKGIHAFQLMTSQYEVSSQDQYCLFQVTDVE